jgi:hypothetical protein
MEFPSFVTQAPSIQLYDPLAHVLGTCKDGLITFEYQDLIKIAGHSCPTVAGAYTMAHIGLSRLYKDKKPTRGEINVLLKDAKNIGNTGVIASVLGIITGASDEGGFKGLNGNFSRTNKLGFEAQIPSDVRLVRTDTNEYVDMSLHLDNLPQDKRLQTHFAGAISFDEDALKHFWEAWHGRVKSVLFEYERYGIVSVV